MKTTTSILLLGVPFGLGACALPAVTAMPGDPPSAQVTQLNSSSSQAPAWAQKPRTEPLLYARDGSVVGAQKPGTLAVDSTAGQSSVADEGSSRWTLLEQYQATIEKNEGLEQELKSLHQALEADQVREAGLTERLAGLTKELSELRTKIETLEGQNIELASRLTTAQIRRLQSEKLLLQAKLDWKRVETTINGSEAPDEETPENSSSAPVEPDPQSTQTSQP